MSCYAERLHTYYIPLHQKIRFWMCEEIVVVKKDLLH